MADITAAVIKTLRDRTSAGMMDCKRALEECNGDMETSIDWLRQKGHAQAAKKSSREAREGLIALAMDENRGALIELASETDFAARNDIFKAAAEKIAHLAAKSGGDKSQLLAQKFSDDGIVEDYVHDVAAQLGENILIKRVAVLEAKPGGRLASYVHNKQADCLGKIGVLVAFSGGEEDLAHKIAMHISAAQPIALTREDIDPAIVARERDVLRAQAQDEGKPENIIDKMVEGRLKKFYQQTALAEQEFILDEDHNVGQVLEKAGMRIDGFLCLMLGED